MDDCPDINFDSETDLITVYIDDDAHPSVQQDTHSSHSDKRVSHTNVFLFCFETTKISFAILNLYSQEAPTVCITL